MFGPYGNYGPGAQPEEFSDNDLKLVPQPIRGTRSFKVTEDGWLRGIYYPQIWVPGWNYAHNWQNKYPAHDTKTDTYECVAPVTLLESQMQITASPGTTYARTTFRRIIDGSRIQEAKARWGFYAYNEGSNDFGCHSDGVAATVEGCGLMVVGTRGFRAPRARIIALAFGEHVNILTIDAVLNNYPDVPAFASFDAMITALPPDHWEKDTE